jgi:hypothetical protein
MNAPLKLRRISRCWPLLIALLCWQPAAAQSPPAGTAADCPTPEAVTPTHLFGLWQLTLGPPESPDGEGQLVFEPHTEFPDSVRGTLKRSAQGQRYQAQVAGDATNKGFQLEESADGVNIDAVWTGAIEPASCGREIRGWRQVVEGRSTQEPVSERAFVLKKAFGWR